MVNSSSTILVTGATGYVGGRLVPVLLEKGYRVRAAGRSVQKLKSRPWASHPNVELASFDVRDVTSLEAVLKDVGVAFYLIHSMLPGQKSFEDADRQAAQNFARAAEKQQVQRIIYLGGLGESGKDLSKHLKSRAEVAQVLGQGKVPVTQLRAAMIMGSGSASFEILRYLVERLPLMVTPKWLKTPSQPIAIRNVIGYLAGCLEASETTGRTFDIGGADVLTYHELMRIYAQEAELPKRLVIPVPVLTPRLSSYWIHLVTPVPASIARPLAEGLKNPVVCQENEIQRMIPQEILGVRKAIHLALESTRQGDIPSRWTDAGKLPPLESVYPGDPKWAGGTVFKDKRELETSVTAKQIWQVIRKIGGKTGWYHANWLWELRGGMDRLCGGVGLRRGRRDQHNLAAGDSLDFWRVLDVDPEKRLLLVAEMKLPGKATLEFIIHEHDGKRKLEQTARFASRGLWGILYWFLVAPLHGYVFQGMLEAIIRQAEAVNVNS